MDDEIDADWYVSPKDRLERQIEGAKDHVNRLIAHGFLANDKDWIRAWYTFDLKWLAGDDGPLTMPRDRVAPFVHAASENRAVCDLAVFFAGTRMKNGERVPEPLERFVGEHLTNERLRPAGSRGPARKWGRDFIIIDAMWRLIEENGISATCQRDVDVKGTRKREKSASEIVVDALKRTEIGHMDLQRIQRIWGCKKAQSDYDEARGIYYRSQFDWLDEPDWV